MDGKYDLGAAVAIALDTMATESKSDRADKYPDYKSDPPAETLKTLDIMSTHTEFAANYEKLMGDMVYGSGQVSRRPSRLWSALRNKSAKPENDFTERDWDTYWNPAGPVFRKQGFSIAPASVRYR